MRIGIRHLTRYEYGEPAVGLTMLLRLMPRTLPGQTVENWSVSIDDKPVQRWTVNGLGESEALWRAPAKLDAVNVIAEGVVVTEDRAGVLGALQSHVRPAAFLRPTDLTEADAALIELASEINLSEGPLNALHNLSDLIHERIAYKPGSTTSATTAAQAFDLGKGVCQDMTHIFLAVARQLHIPARYVAGYYHDDSRPVDGRQTHAWAEAYVDSLGWVGFDPTRGFCPIDGHVRLTAGMDAADAAPIRGVYSRGASPALSLDVHIAALPLDAINQGQTQQ